MVQSQSGDMNGGNSQAQKSHSSEWLFFELERETSRFGQYRMFAPPCPIHPQLVDSHRLQANRKYSGIIAQAELLRAYRVCKLQLHPQEALIGDALLH